MVAYDYQGKAGASDEISSMLKFQFYNLPEIEIPLQH